MAAAEKLSRFLTRASDCHGGKYDYSRVTEWPGNKSHVCIVCPEHGEFFQTPASHLTRRKNREGYMGCRKCGVDLRLGSGRFAATFCRMCGCRIKYGAKRTRCESCLRAWRRSPWRKALQRCAGSFRKTLRTGWSRWAYMKATNLNNFKHLGPNGTKHAERVATTWWEGVELAADRLALRMRRQRRSEWSKRMKAIATSMSKSADQRRQGERIMPTQLLELLETQNYKCALTGCDLSPDDVSVDHCVPTSRGGQHCIENIQLVTKTMNKMKGTLTNAELLALCKQVVSTLGD